MNAGSVRWTRTPGRHSLERHSRHSRPMLGQPRKRGLDLREARLTVPVTRKIRVTVFGCGKRSRIAVTQISISESAGVRTESDSPSRTVQEQTRWWVRPGPGRGPPPGAGPGPQAGADHDHHHYAGGPGSLPMPADLHTVTRHPTLHVAAGYWQQHKDCHLRL